MQSKKESLIESITNVSVGFVTTLILSPPLYWLANVEINYFQMTHLTLLFTVVSVARSYIIRRWFNKKEK